MLAVDAACAILALEPLVFCRINAFPLGSIYLCSFVCRQRSMQFYSAVCYSCPKSCSKHEISERATSKGSFCPSGLSSFCIPCKQISSASILFIGTSSSSSLSLVFKTYAKSDDSKSRIVPVHTERSFETYVKLSTSQFHHKEWFQRRRPTNSMLNTRQTT